jgi:spore coat protein H
VKSPIIAAAVLLLASQSARGVSNLVNGIAIDYEPNVPLVVLDAKGPIASDQKVACTVKVAAPKGAAGGMVDPLAGEVKFHGATSQGYRKKSFRLSLEAPAELLGLPKRSQWVLNAAYVDRSLMRHKISYDLFRSLSTPGAKRFAAGSQFVELYLNGKYRGVYLLMERVDRRLLELRAYSSNENHHACIYKAVDHAANFAQPGHGGYEQHEPDPPSGPYWRPLDEFNSFVSSSPDPKLFDPQTGIAARLDLGNAIDFHLLVLLTSNMDGITKNFILARDAPTKEVPQPRFFFAPWDYDATFGRNWEASRVEPTAWLSNRLFDRLLGASDYRGRFAERWKQLRASQFSVKSIHAMIDANVRTLGEAARRNAAKWPTTEGYPDKLTFDQDITEMKAWVIARTQWLDQEIGKLEGKR